MTDSSIEGHEEISMQETPADAAIRLITPQEGALTPPLQLTPWTRPEPAPKAEQRASSRQVTQAEASERGLPRPITFTWELVDRSIALGAQVQYDLDIFPTGLERETTRIYGLTAPQAEVINLRIGTPYTWRVTAYRAGRSASPFPIAGPVTGTFITHPSPPRWIHVPGITNVRDMGGWALPGGRRVRQGRLYRGSEMNSHCEITPLGREVLLEKLGIRTDLDLRGPGEERKAVLPRNRVEYVNIPLTDYDMIIDPDYIARFRALFRLLATPNMYPIYMHCWGGADRTGTAAFLLGALLGMSAADLALDYELTSLSIMGQRLSSQESYNEMLTVLAGLKEKDSSLQAQVEHYLKVIGVTDEEVARIRNELTE